MEMGGFTEHDSQKARQSACLFYNTAIKLIGGFRAILPTPRVQFLETF